MAGSGYFRIQGADGQPIEVPASQFYFNTKARCRRMMLNSLSGEARQVYAALELGTMGFQQEKAVMSRNGVTRRMTPGDITTMTGLDKGSVRRALVELEGAGLAERRPVDASLPLQKGNVEIYSWAEPRPAQEVKRWARAPTIPDWVPESWDTLTAAAKRWRIPLCADLGDARSPLIAEGEELARELKAVELRVARFLERGRAPNALNKEERTDITRRKKGGEEEPPPPAPASSVPPQSPPPPVSPAPAPVSAAPPQNGNGHGNGAGTAVVRVQAPADLEEKRILYDRWR